jgi:hypothetical protein
VNRENLERPLFLKKLTALAALPAILFCEALAALFLLFAAGVPERIVAEEGSRLTGGTVTVEDLRVGLLDGVEIVGLRAEVGGGSGLSLDVKSLLLRFRASSILAGRFFPEAVTLFEPDLHFHGDPHRFQDLMQGGEGAGNLPDFEVAVRKGTVRMGWLSLDADGLDVNFSCDGEGSCHLEGAAFALRGESGEQLGLMTIRGDCDASREPATCQVTVEGEDVVCCPAIEGVLEAAGILRFYSALRPSGKASVVFESDPFLLGDAPTGRLSLRPCGVTSAYVGFVDQETGERSIGFPYSVADLEGLLTVRFPEQVRFRNLCGTSGGGCAVVNGEFSESEGEWGGGVFIRASDVEIDDELIRALDEVVGGGDIFEQLGFYGKTDALVAIEVLSTGSGSPSADEYYVRVGVDVKRAAMRPVFFPFPLEEIRGRAVFEKSLCTLSDLRGERDGVVVAGGGTVSGEETLIRLEAEHVTVGPELLDALRAISPDTVDLVESLQYSGGDLDVGFEFEMRGGDGTWDFIRIVVSLCRGSARLPGPFPLLVDDLSGTVTVELSPAGIERIELAGVTGAYEGSSLRLNALLERGEEDEESTVFDGSVFAEGSGLVLKKIDMAGCGFPLDRKIMEAAAGLGGALRDVVEGSSVEGDIDFEYSDGPDGASFLVKPHLGMVSSPHLPFPLSHVDGEVSWDSSSDRIIISGLNVRLARGGVFAEKGSVVPIGTDTLIVFQGSGHALRLKEELGCLLGEGGFGKWGLEGVEGQASFEDADIKVLLGEKGELLSLQGSVEAYLDRAAVAAPVRLENLNGKVTLNSRKQDREGRILDLFGYTSDLLFRLEGNEFSNVKISIHADDDSFSILSLDGNLFEGHITGGDDAFSLNFAPPSAFSGRVKVEGTDINRLVDRSGYAFKDTSGRLEWDARFSGNFDEIHKMNARGKIEIENGRLWRLPVFGTIWNVVSGLFGGSDEVMTFDNGSARYHLANGTLTLSDAVLNSSLLALHASGVLTLDAANLQVRFSMGPRIPVLGFVIDPVMRLVTKGIFNVRISGPYEDLEVTYDPILTSPFRSGEISEHMRCPTPKDYEVTGRF